MTETWHAVVRGAVQGVGFRWFAREQARALGVAGWVKNRRDGSVEVVARGEGAQLEQFKTILQRGPRGAVVEATEQLSSEGDTVGDSFDIVR